MAGPLRVVVLFLALAGSPALAQQVDPNFQALLNALMHGAPAALLTPLPDGTLQVTSVTVPGQRSAAEAAALIQRAQITLGNLGVVQPTGEQLARALAGGTIDVPAGRTQIGGVLPPGAAQPTINTQIVTSGSLPLVIGPSSAGVGASAPPPAAQQPLVTPMPPTPFSQPR
jgi:hypothetical protein